jgi:hypothetical protein
LYAAAVAPRTAVPTGTALTPGQARFAAGATIATGAPVTAGAALVAREPHQCCLPKSEVSFDVRGRAVGQTVENALAILDPKLVQQLVGADDTRLGATGPFLSEQTHHRLGQLPVVDDAGRTPHAGTSNRAPLPPPPHDDDEITTAEDRAAMLARDADASAMTVNRVTCVDVALRSKTVATSLFCRSPGPIPLPQAPVQFRNRSPA